MSTDKTYDFLAYSVGLCAASCCTSLTPAEAAKRLNKEKPTGIDSDWEYAEGKNFKCGTPNGAQCPDFPTHKHYLMRC